jgi:hypothetical protein
VEPQQTSTPPATEKPAEQAVAAPIEYKDDDLVYVDPDNRTIVGLVQWSNTGKPKAMPMKMEETDEEEEGKDGKRRRKKRQRYYPWGTLRSMKRVYKIGGKVIGEDNRKTLDEVIEKALKEPYWD